MIPYDETGFEEAAGTVLAPWLRDHVTGGTFSSFDGTKIQYYSAVRPDAKSVVVMLHGYCEFFGKFHETAHHFWENGYTVFFIEHRGHGGSGRSVEDPDLVDVKDFSEYVEDLKCLLDKVVLPQTPEVQTRAGVRVENPEDGGWNGEYQPDGGRSGERNGEYQPDGGRSGERKADESAHGKRLLLYAHSMGGCIGALFLERHPEYFTAAVLSSPMLKMTFGATPLWQVNALFAASHLPGWSRRPLPGMQHFDPEKTGFEESGSVSRARFMYQFNLRRDPETGGIYTMNGGTLGWVRAAIRATDEVMKNMDRIRIPLLICQAGKDVYVDNEGQNEAAEKAKHARLVRFPEAKHEIYAGDPQTLKKYYAVLDRFFNRASTYAIQ